MQDCDAVYGELLICGTIPRVCRCCYCAAMRDLIILFVHVITTLARLMGPRRRPLRGRRIRSRQAATPDPESIPTAGAQTPAIRSFRRRIVRSLHASCSPDPFCNRTETLNPIGPPPRADKAKVPRAVPAETRAQARAKGRPEKSSTPLST